MENASLPPELARQLRALPALSPSPELTRRVEKAALALLSGDAAAVHDLDAMPAWRAFLTLFAYRAALPSALAAATVIYLNWAIQAASQLY